MPEIILQRSSRPDKKWMVTLPDDKVVHFGSSAHQDYTQHGDKERQQRYLKRHEKREDWGDWTTPGFWSRWLLWSSPSLAKAIRHLKHKFNLNIVYKQWK